LGTRKPGRKILLARARGPSKKGSRRLPQASGRGRIFFYGPFRQLLGTSERLYTEFRARQPEPDKFRTLLALLSGKKFTGNDKVLLEQIIEITQKLDDLILAKSALVKEGLQATLWEASTHFRLIRLAYKGDLSGEPDRFERFVYPRALNPAIDAEIGRLRGRLEELRKLGVQ
jgi:hypothetical protein